MPQDNAKTSFERHPLNVFQDEISRAAVIGAAKGDALPFVETTKEVLQYFNKSNWKQFEDAGYFIFKNCIVCETGKSDEVRKKMSMDLEDKLHPKRVVTTA